MGGGGRGEGEQGWCGAEVGEAEEETDLRDKDNPSRSCDKVRYK